MSKPVRKLRLTLMLEADTVRDLANALTNLAIDAEREGLSQSCVSGGMSSSYVYELLTNPEQTHERYFAELRAHLAGESA